MVYFRFAGLLYRGCHRCHAPHGAHAHSGANGRLRVRGVLRRLPGRPLAVQPHRRRRQRHDYRGGFWFLNGTFFVPEVMLAFWRRQLIDVLISSVRVTKRQGPCVVCFDVVDLFHVWPSLSTPLFPHRDPAPSLSLLYLGVRRVVRRIRLLRDRVRNSGEEVLPAVTAVKTTATELPVSAV